MENSNKSESTVIIVFSIIILIILALLVYTAYNSTSKLQSNSNTYPDTSKNAQVIKEEPDKTNEPIIPVTPIPVETQISTFSSNIYDKDANRVYNIGIAIAKINGAIVKKGEIFSFNDTVGPMGEAQGFKKATGFDSDGKKIEMFGGGMCQISSTIYNAALIANLEIVERHPHSRRVYYVPKDKDATIYYGSLDLKFKNTTNDDIKIIATNTDSNVTIVLNKITSGI